MNRIKDRDLWESYRAWAMRNDADIKITSARFKQSIADTLRGQGVQRKKSIRFSSGKVGRGFEGIDLINPE